MARSAIEWTDATWNPVTGCRHCYAEHMAPRLRAMGQRKYRRGFQVTLHRGELARPPRWRKPRKVFVNSMSDLFHEAVPAGFIGEVFAVMARCRRHTFQVLTKRPSRLHEPFLKEMEWPANVWTGVSIESERHLSHAAILRMTGARVKFLSLEPLLGPPPGLDLDGIDWVIAGNGIRLYGCRGCLKCGVR